MVFNYGQYTVCHALGVPICINERVEVYNNRIQQLMDWIGIVIVLCRAKL